MSFKLVLASLLLVIGVVGATGIAGGIGEERNADEKVQNLIESLRSEISSRAGEDFKTLQAVKYKTQTVAGLNYFVKVRAVNKDDKESFIHVRIYKHFKNPQELTEVQKNHSLETPIMYFERKDEEHQEI